MTVPIEYCDEAQHNGCLHATIIYDPTFHKDDQLRKLNFSDSFSIPDPEICRALWKYVSETIERRKPDEEAAFLAKWGDSVYNIVELTTLKDLGYELLKTKRDVKEEEYFLTNGNIQIVPVGIDHIDEEDHHISLAIKKALKDELFLKPDTPLSTVERSIQDYLVLDNEQIYNFCSPSRQLTEDELHIVTEILNEESKGNDKFLVLTPEMANEPFCKEYATQKGCDLAKNIHVIVNVNLSKNKVNLTEQNGHWVYTVIKSENEVIYGDPMGSANVPTNLLKVLNPIFMSKFGKNMSPKDIEIKNVSNNANFPTQTCGTICGLVSAMICVFSFSPQLYNEVMYGRTENQELEFIRNPSYFADQLRMRFLKIVMSKTHCVETFFPKQMTFHYREGDEQFKTRRAKSKASKAWESLKSKSRPLRSVPLSSKTTSSTDNKLGSKTGSTATSSEATNNFESMPKSSHAGVVPSASTPPTDSTAESVSTPLVAPSRSPSIPVEEFRLVKSTSIGLKSMPSGTGYPNHDGFRWQPSGKKTKGPKTFICSNDGCTATKRIFKTKQELKKKLNKKNPRDPVNVSYITAHSCKHEANRDYVLFSSYQLQMVGKKKNSPEETTTDENPAAMNNIENDVLKRGIDGNINDNEEVIKETATNEEDGVSPIGDIEENIQDTLFDDETSSFYNENNESPVSSTEQEFAELQEDSNIEPNDPNDNSLDSTLHAERRDNLNDVDYQEEDVDKPKSTENTHGPDAEIFSCYICKFVTIVKVDFNVHQQMDHDKICLCCEYITTTDSLLNEHREIYGHFICVVCDFQANSEELKTHCRDEHGSIQSFGEERESNKTNSTGIGSEANVQILKQHECHLCKFMTRVQSEFDAHMKLPHGKICMCCDFRTTTEPFLYEHKQIHGHFKCDECKFQSHSEDILKRHKIQEHVNPEEVSFFNSLFRGSSRKRMNTENDRIQKRMRINETLREASPEDMFDSNDEAHDEENFNKSKSPNISENLNTIQSIADSALESIVDSGNGQRDSIDSRPTSDIASESYSCFMCDFVTDCLYNYNIHTLTTHSLLCEVCGYETTTAQLLKEHKKRKRHFRCEMCSYTESCEALLEEHRNNEHAKQVQAETVGIRKGNNYFSGGSQKRIRRNETNQEPDDKSDGADDGSVQERNYRGEDNDAQKGGDKRKDNDAIKTKHVTNYLDSLDDNEGNVAYIVTNYPETKKPKSDRNKTNWGPSQSQRGKTTVYPCAGCYVCESCGEKSTCFGDCSTCKVPRKQIPCPARKYVYFCEQNCVRELYKDCCKSEPKKKKLVILYVDKHNCTSVDSKPRKKKSYQFKEVKCKDDIMDNLHMYVENELIDFDIVNLGRVPSNIDNNHFYLLDVNENKEIKEIIRDGRKWQTFSQTTSKVFGEILGEKNVKKVKKYRCANQYFCYNTQCPFKKRFEIVNQIQFTKEANGTRTCVSCSEKMEMVTCNAEKYIAKSNSNKYILIKHVGKHKCLSKSVLESQILEEIEDYFSLNPTATRSEAIVHHLIAKINYGTRQEVMDLVAVSLNLWELNNVKAKGIKRLNPHGNKLDAVRLLKSKLEDMGNPYDIIIKVYEDVYVCDSCSYISEKENEGEECVKFCKKCSMTAMDHVGPSIFITSKDSLSTMRELTASRSLETEACCLDHQPSRLREYTTFAGYCYDTDLRRMCPLFAAVMTNERELSVYHCLDVLDRCMKEVFDSNTGFDPNMIIADEATAIKNAVSRKLGNEKVMKQYGTCQLHFMSSVLQHCSFVIGNKKQIWQFMKLSEHLMNAECPELYDLFKTELLAFISETEQRHSHLFNWLEFYDQRRTGWSKAYRNAELPKTNKGESGNAHYSNVTHLTKMTLDLGVKAMVAEMHVYSGCRRGITNGQYKGGKGPSKAMMDEKLVSETFTRIKNTPMTSNESTAFVKSVLERIGLNDETENENFKMPATKQRSVLATHRYLADQIKARTEARIESPKFVNAPHVKAPKKSMKRKLKFADTLEDLENVDQPKKRRKDSVKGSSLNGKILQTLTDGFTLTTVEVGIYKVMIKNDPERCYTINVNANPTCTCPEFARIQKARQTDRNTSICKHISVICLCLGFDFGSAIIRRYAYTATQRMLMTLKTAAFCHTNVNIADIKKKFENEMYQKLEPEVQDLPYLDIKKYYGIFKTYEEAKLFLTELTERFPCKWFGLTYEEARYMCTSGFHATQEDKKLRQKLSKARPLVFLVHLTSHVFISTKPLTNIKHEMRRNTST